MNGQQRKTPGKTVTQEEAVAVAYIRTQLDPTDPLTEKEESHFRLHQHDQIVDRATGDGTTIKFWAEEDDPNPDLTERVGMRRTLLLMNVAKIRTCYMLDPSILSSNPKTARIATESFRAAGIDLRFVHEA